MVIIALILRLGVIFVTHTYKFKTVDDNFSFGYEMGRIGRLLARALLTHSMKRPGLPPGSRRCTHF